MNFSFNLALFAPVIFSFILITPMLLSITLWTIAVNLPAYSNEALRKYAETHSCAAELRIDNKCIFDLAAVEGWQKCYGGADARMFLSNEPCLDWNNMALVAAGIFMCLFECALCSLMCLLVIWPRISRK